VAIEHAPRGAGADVRFGAAAEEQITDIVPPELEAVVQRLPSVRVARVEIRPTLDVQ